jgi:hypothetical protein
MAERGANEILTEILEEVRKPRLQFDFSPGIAQVRRAAILAGLAAGRYVPDDIAKKAAQALVDAAEKLKVFQD